MIFRFFCSIILVGSLFRTDASRTTHPNHFSINSQCLTQKSHRALKRRKYRGLYNHLPAFSSALSIPGISQQFLEPEEFLLESL
mmetsp:Transcript_5713/g.12055  ORF Transcript_5713/g.12055 Transcript_5713/m.12055 type:complete len:84 (+) Transcript_5713:224-475(+)